MPKFIDDISQENLKNKKTYMYNGSISVRISISTIIFCILFSHTLTYHIGVNYFNSKSVNKHYQAM